MQIVIEISDHLYKCLQKRIELNVSSEVDQVIAKGTLLPEHHGNFKAEPCEDAVSREAVLNALRTCYDTHIIERENGSEYIDYEMAVNEVGQLPPVTPKQRTGHWFVDERPESDREIICSNCEQPVFKYHKMDFDYRPKYCPNCGAKMEGESE